MKINYNSNSIEFQKIIFGNKYKSKKNQLFVTESFFDSPIWKQLPYAPNILKKFQNLEFNDKSFLENFQYNNFSLYWFFYPYIYAEIKNTANLLNELTILFQKSQSTHFHINENFRNFNSLHDLCKKQNQIFSFSKNNFLKYKLSKNLKLKVREKRLEKITKLKIEHRKKLYYKKYNEVHDFTDKILIASPEIFHRSIINSKIGKIENGEFALHEILNLLNNSYDFVGLSIDYEIKPNFEKLNERLNSNIPWIPIEALLSKNNIPSHIDFIKNFSSLITNSKFHELFLFDEINYWESFERVFRQMIFYPYIPLWLNLFDSLNILFKKSKPKAVVLTYETGPIALAIINACKNNNIKTISMQHGIIAKNWKYYTIDPLETKSNLGFPLPDKMLLYGNFSKNILLENNFPNEKLQVFGNPEFFNFESKKQILQRTNLRKKYGIKDNQKIILFTPIVLEKEFNRLDESETELNYNLRVWEHLLNNFNSDSNFHIFLKPHPGENDNLYKKLYQKYDCENANIISENILELISISDIVVTMFSSIILDALCFNKSVIEINYPKINSPIEFDKMGNITQSNIGEIAQNIKNIINNPETQKLVNQNSPNTVKEIYGIPENDSLKILNEILSS